MDDVNAHTGCGCCVLLLRALTSASSRNYAPKKLTNFHCDTICAELTCIVQCQRVRAYISHSLSLSVSRQGVSRQGCSFPITPPTTRILFPACLLNTCYISLLSTPAHQHASIRGSCNARVVHVVCGGCCSHCGSPRFKVPLKSLS